MTKCRSKNGVKYAILFTGKNYAEVTRFTGGRVIRDVDSTGMKFSDYSSEFTPIVAGNWIVKGEDEKYRVYRGEL